MNYFNLKDFSGHEQVSFFYDAESGLKAIIAIHNTLLGPALGGVRMWNYATDEEALIDALRLSKGMTYKSAATGLKLGGGKAVIIGDPKKQKTELLMRTFGKAVQSLGGRYITAEDVGTDVQDMEYIRQETFFVTGIEKDHGGSGSPAPFTAFGVFQGLRAGVERKFKQKDLSGLTVAVQGLGNVGWELAKLLLEAKAKVIGADIDEKRAQAAKKELGVHEIVHVDEIYSVACDVFAPCALGAIINDNTIDKIKAKVIAGAANNQLKDAHHGDVLYKKGVLYVPDYILNAGGLINVYTELEGYSRTRSLRYCKRIYDNCHKVFDISEKEGKSTYLAADRMVEQRLSDISLLQNRFNTFNREAFDKRKN